MYRSSAELVRYLTKKYDIPVDRAHILGHDNVPGINPAGVQAMHEDPGPYWDWAHYFDLLGKPLHATAGPRSGMVTILPDYDKNVVPYTGCDANNPDAACPPHGGGSIMLRTAPSADAPLVKDIGKHPPNGDATMSVYDHSARAATGQTTPWRTGRVTGPRSGTSGRRRGSPTPRPTRPPSGPTASS